MSYSLSHSTGKPVRLDPGSHDVLEPKVHDAHIVGILQKDGRETRLWITSYDKEEFTLCIYGIRNASGDGLQEGSIILHIAVLPSDKIGVKEIESACEMTDVEPYRTKYMERIRTAVRDAQLVLVM